MVCDYPWSLSTSGTIPSWAPQASGRTPEGRCLPLLDLKVLHVLNILNNGPSSASLPRYVPRVFGHAVTLVDNEAGSRHDGNAAVPREPSLSQGPTGFFAAVPREPSLSQEPTRFFAAVPREPSLSQGPTGFFAAVPREPSLSQGLSLIHI